jgi:oxygen-independent coproporphyrinogen-3 oxidase
MTECLLLELELRKGYLSGHQVDTMYFGGGTPSLLPLEGLERLLEKIFAIFPGKKSEVTLEANPDDLSPERLRQWKGMGIDRLSLGIQSFQEEILRAYNRIHTATESKYSIELARKAGFEKFSIDLIYGYPHSDHSLWEKDLTEALFLDPGHISAYALTIEPKTAFGYRTRKGSFRPADEDFVAEQFEWLQEQTDRAGYIQYEISNFGREGHFAVHNSHYWLGKPYLGIGPSAHSFDGENRGYNPPSNPVYSKNIQAGRLPFLVEPLSPSDRINEKILTGLRTIWGLDAEELLRKFHYDLIEIKKDQIKNFEDQGWLEVRGKTLSLTRRGQLLADSIASELFI